MSKAFLILVCLLFLEGVLVVAHKSAPCPSGWFSYRCSKSCYKAPLKQARTWHMARKACLSMGGDMVVIESKTENDYVAFLARTVQRGYSAFIGIVRDRSNNFKWVNGIPLSRFTNWKKPGEPSNIYERCAEMYISSFKYLGTWNDCYCSYPINRNYICEREKVRY